MPSKNRKHDRAQGLEGQMSFVHNHKIFKGPLRKKGRSCCVLLCCSFFFLFFFLPSSCSDESAIQSATDGANDEKLKQARAGMRAEWRTAECHKERDWLRRKGRLELKWVRGQDSRLDAHHSDYRARHRHRMHFCEILTVTNTNLFDRYGTSNCKLMAQSESERDLISFKATTHSDLHANPCFTRV